MRVIKRIVERMVERIVERIFGRIFWNRGCFRTVSIRNCDGLAVIWGEKWGKASNIQHTMRGITQSGQAETDAAFHRRLLFRLRFGDLSILSVGVAVMEPGQHRWSNHSPFHPVSRHQRAFLLELPGDLRLNPPMRSHRIVEIDGYFDNTVSLISTEDQNVV